nr:AsnC family transcriptional regulator [Pseudolysinimonas kribbensis]
MDSLDYGIIDLLRQNSRAGYADIGDRVGLSASAVKRRVDRLVAEESSARSRCRSTPPSTATPPRRMSSCSAAAPSRPTS